MNCTSCNTPAPGHELIDGLCHKCTANRVKDLDNACAELLTHATALALDCPTETLAWKMWNERDHQPEKPWGTVQSPIANSQKPIIETVTGTSFSAWIGVDLDGTLAVYGGWKGPDHIGKPIQPMLDRVKRWMAEGKTVRIFTARACIPEQVPPIKAWLARHGLGALEVTNIKDYGLIEFWDDRAVQVEANTGRPLACVRHCPDLKSEVGK